RGLVDERDADAGNRVVAANGGIELVVDPGAHDVVGDVRAAGERDRRRVQSIGDGRRDAAEIHVEVLDLAGHIADQSCFETGAEGPARLYRQYAHRRRDHVDIAVGVDRRTRQIDR